MATLLEPDRLAAALRDLDGWEGTTDQIVKRYRFTDFAAAMAFVNRVAAVAEERNHHPDIAISWNKVTLTILSHAAGGVTENCVALAAAVDAVVDDHPSPQ